jgi:hypothetical protein
MPSKVDMNVTLDTAGVEKMVSRAVKRLGKTEVALAEVGTAILANNEKSWGKRWAPLAESTQEQKTREGESSEPGVRSGALKASLTKPGAEHQIHEISKTRLRLGTDLFYARFMQGTKHQPKRPTMRLTPTVRREIKAVLKDKLMPGGKD